jgi:TP901 family phage tail tape measure protein
VPDSSQELTIVVRLKDLATKAIRRGLIFSLNRLKRVAFSVGRVLKRSLFGPLQRFIALVSGVALFARLTRDALNFSQAMSEVSTIVDVSSGRMAVLSEEVLGVAQATGQLETVVAGGLYQAISSGAVDASNAMDLLESASRLAVAGLADVTQTVDLLTSAFNAYGFEATESGRISDVFFEAVRLGKTTIQELSVSMGQVTPIAAQLGVSLEEVVGAVVQITRQGVGTAEAVTQVRSALTATLRRSKDISEAFESVGESFSIADLRSRGLVAILQDLRRVTGGNEDQLVRLLGRVEAVAAALNLTGSNAAATRSIIAQLTESAGAAGEAFEKRLEDPAFKVRAALNALRIEVQAAGAAFINRLARGIDEIGGIDGIKDLASAVKDGLVVAFDALAETLSNAALRFKQFQESIGSPEVLSNIVAKSVGVLASSVQLLTSVVGNAILALGGAIFQIGVFVRRTLASIPGSTLSGTREDAQAQLEKLLKEQREIRSDLAKEFSGNRGEFGKLLEDLIGFEGDTFEATMREAERVNAEVDRVRELIKILPSEAEDPLISFKRQFDELAISSNRAAESFEASIRAFLFSLEGLDEQGNKIEQTSKKAKSAFQFFLEAAATDTVAVFQQANIEILRLQALTLGQAFIGGTIRLGQSAPDREAGEPSSFKKFVDGFKKGMTEIREEWIELGNVGTRVAQDLANQLAGGIPNALFDVASGARTAKEAFKDFALSTLRLINNLVVEFLVLRAVSSVFGGGSTTNAGRGAVFQGGISPVEAGRGAIFSGGFRAFAGGGVVTKPTLGLIGETGQNEAVVPLKDGTKIPVENMGSGVGPINITFQVVDASGADQFLVRRTPTIISIIQRALQERRDFRAAIGSVSGAQVQVT